MSTTPAPSTDSMASSQCIAATTSRRLHGYCNGNLPPLHILPARVYTSSNPVHKLPLRTTALTPQSSRDLLLKIRLSPLTGQCHRRRAHTAGRTSACHHAATPSRAGSNGDVLTSLAIAVAIPVVGGVLASFIQAANFEWYKNLRKPKWNPPSWIFGGAWGVLYAVMGFASWLVWLQGGWNMQGRALTLYSVQLVLNLAWPILFFGVKHIGLALLDILALWASLFACIRAFQVVNPLAGRLLYPYLAWVTFASVLNYRYLDLNNKPQTVA